MRKLKLLMTCLLVVASFSLVSAQTKTVSGTVTSAEDGMPVIGASVVVKGNTTIGTLTDVEGRYSMSVPTSTSTLIISYIGMKSIEVAAAPNQRVVMDPDASELDEVIVVAYGTVTREGKTGAVSTVGGDKIAAAPVVSVDKALGGKIAGVSITSQSGQPGASSSIRIRGTSSINAGNNPLWVVDGIPVMTGNASTFLNTGNMLASLNPNDIENITVLKDAAAASIYGSRAANGVILVTTKSGKAGKTTFNARAKFGTSWLANDNDFGIMSAAELLAFQRDAVINAGGNPDDPTDSYYRPKELLTRPLTNWLNHVTRQGSLQEYEISASGSNARSKYYTSLTMNDTEGVFYGVDLQKIGGRMNAEYKLTDKLESGGRVNLVYTHGNDIPMQSLYYANPMWGGLNILPWTPTYDSEGNHNVNISENSNTNPRATAFYDKQFSKGYQLMGNVYLQYKPISNVTLKTTNAIESSHNEGDRYWAPETHKGTATLQTDMSKFVRLTTSNTASYDNIFNDVHSVRALLGQEAMRYQGSQIFVYAPGVNPDIPYVQTAPDADIQAEQWNTAETLLSFFGLIDYNYAEKYYIQASLRNDGSSLFGQNNIWGTFYSVGLSWNMHNENFMRDIDMVKLLKLRASYGLNGNNNISAYRAYGVYTSSSYNGAVGMRPSRPENPYLSWEKNGTWNVGLDVNLWGKLDASVDLYERLTTDMLLDKNVPQTTGFSSNFLNIGSLRNRGLELQLNYTILNNRDFNWTVGGNIAFNKTKILDLGDNEEIAYSGDSRLRHIVGKPLYTFRLFDYYGVDPTNGEALFIDANGQLTNNYNVARYNYDYTPEPLYLGGFNTNFAWKGLSLGAFFEYKGGNHVLLIEKRYLESDGAEMGTNHVRTALNYWKQPGDTGVNPKPIAGNATNSNSFGTTRFLQRGDYIRLKDVTLSYDLPRSFVSKLKINNVRFYTSAQNIYTFHDVDWFDPERGVDGIGYGIYPMSKSIVGGVEISF